MPRIYKTTNTVNGKIYIGKDSNDRDGYLGSGKILKSSIKKYGLDNFEKVILEECDLTDIDNREIYWIDKLDATNPEIGYNICVGGQGGGRVAGKFHHSDKTKEIIARLAKQTWDDDGYRSKMAETNNCFMNPKRGKDHHAYGKPLSEAHKKKAIEALNKGRKKMWSTPGMKEHMSNKMKGREITWNDKISEANKKRYSENPPVITEGTKQKISDKMKGYEFKSYSTEVETRVCDLYSQCGSVRMSKLLENEGIEISPYKINTILKKHGLYEKGRKKRPELK